MNLVDLSEALVNKGLKLELVSLSRALEKRRFYICSEYAQIGFG